MNAEEQENVDAKRPSRHALIMRGVVTPIFGLLAVAAVVLGVMNATIWKPSARIEAAAQISGTRYIVTDPGVLPLVDADVTLHVKASKSSQEVCVALGAAKDVVGWVSGNDYTRVTGLSEWTALSTQKAKSHGDKPSDDTSVAFTDSDMWSDATCDTGSVSITSDDTEGTQVALIDLGDAKAKATVTLDWTRHILPDFAMPFYFAGGLCAVCAVLTATVFAMPPHKRRKKTAQGAASVAGDIAEGAAESVAEGAAAAAEEVSIGAAVAGTFASLGRSVRNPFAGKKKRRRHARRSGTSTAVEESTGMPTIVDPAARNLVADQQNGGADSGSMPDSTATGSGDSTAVVADEAATSVISEDELQAYFSRLAQEVGASMDETTDESDAQPTADDPAADGETTGDGASGVDEQDGVVEHEDDIEQEASEDPDAVGESDEDTQSQEEQ